MGDGIVMATEIGADTAGLGHMTLHGPQVTSQNTSDFINLDRMGTDGNPLKIRIGMFAREPTTIWVNKDGQRFVDEGFILQFFAYGNVISQQPEGICYSIFDNATIKIMEEQGLYMQAAPRWATPYEALTPLPGLERGFHKHSGEVLKISNSWDELADWMGTDRKVLKATIDEYNAACDRGYDPIFCKDRRYLLPLRTAPYYAIRGHAGICDTMGGIKVNEKMEVLDTKNKPIPGLFGAGATVGCWESETYCYRLTGHLVGFALNSGRIAAETAFAYLSK
jgi:fumarate reductase flavoprotein subunit